MEFLEEVNFNFNLYCLLLYVIYYNIFIPIFFACLNITYLNVCNIQVMHTCTLHISFYTHLVSCIHYFFMCLIFCIFRSLILRFNSHMYLRFCMIKYIFSYIWHTLFHILYIFNIFIMTYINFISFIHIRHLNIYPSQHPLEVQSRIGDDIWKVAENYYINSSWHIQDAVVEMVEFSPMFRVANHFPPSTAEEKKLDVFFARASLWAQVFHNIFISYKI